MQEALQLVKDGAEASTAEHRLELHAYHALARAHINTEKLQVMRMHLQVGAGTCAGMCGWVRQARSDGAWVRQGRALGA